MYVFLYSCSPLEWIASCPGRFTPEEAARGTHGTGVCVSTSAGMDAVSMREDLLHSRRLSNILLDLHPS
jgi:hypothetical protein